ncbi:MAG TPA: RsmE family RNA methyltransferase [Gemmataceae bacterium]|nr:RsmE family RNA methyltransferase [Gemmataceae bacterium]
MADRFHVNCALGPGPVELDGPEAHHLATVCRLRPGDLVYLFNGDGHEYSAEVTQLTRRTVSLRVLRVESPERELGFRLEVAAPLPKGDRAQFLVEKLTELGVTRFVPLTTARSVVEPREAKQEKLQRYVIEASKQCGRNVLMQIASPAEWSTYCGRADLPPLRVLAHPGGMALSSLAKGVDTALAVGPEGGLTDEEVEASRAAGWRVVGLGPRILRVETAAVLLAGWFGSG